MFPCNQTNVQLGYAVRDMSKTSRYAVPSDRSIKRSVPVRWNEVGVDQILDVLWQRGHSLGALHKYDLLATCKMCDLVTMSTGRSAIGNYGHNPLQGLTTWIKRGS